MYANILKIIYEVMGPQDEMQNVTKQSNCVTNV